MCRSSRVITFRFNGKTQWQMFLLLYGRHVCVPPRAQTWRLHTELYKFVWNTSPNNGNMKNCTALNLGEVVYISIIFHIPASSLNLLSGYDFYFWLRDTANQPFSKAQALQKRQYGAVTLFSKCSFQRALTHHLQFIFTASCLCTLFIPECFYWCASENLGSISSHFVSPRSSPRWEEDKQPDFQNGWKSSLVNPRRV